MKHYSFRLLEPYNQERQAFSIATDMRNAIFLAGPCPRSNYADDWRYEAFDILQELGFTGTVVTPTNDKFTYVGRHEPNILWDQTEWERTMMHMCSALVFWVPRCKKWPALTTNIEFGEWYKKAGVYFGFPIEATHMKYLTLKLKEQKKNWYNDLRMMLADVVRDLQSPKQRKWFTSDTHFGQQRTLELSCRPFIDVTEMDLTMISNWNKSVRANDIVYHAGDFVNYADCGDYVDFSLLQDMLCNLNFKELHWVLGNYDRMYKNKIAAIVEDVNRVFVSDREIKLYDQTDENSTCQTRLQDAEGNWHTYVIVHEPVDFPAPACENAIYLYGHIHGRSFAKINGLDLGTDYHHYAPVSEKQILWYTNAMKYWDKNVYSNKVVTIRRNDAKDAILLMERENDDGDDGDDDGYDIPGQFQTSY